MSKQRTARASKHQVQALALRDAMVNAIDRRVTALTDAGTHVAVEWAIIRKGIAGDNGQGFVNALATLHGLIDVAPLVDMLPNHDAKGTPAVRYVQAKSVQKVVNALHALAGGTCDKMSAYTLQVLRAALDNGGAISLTGAQASLSRRIAKPDAVTLTSRANYTPGTASAQASQVREVVRVLKLGDVNKGKRDDTLTLSEQALTKLRAVFAMGEGEQVTEGEGETVTE